MPNIVLKFHMGFLTSNYTLKTGIPIEEGDSILKLLRRVSRPEIQLGMGIHSELDFFQVRSKLFTFSLKKLSTSSFILNFLECKGYSI